MSTAFDDAVRSRPLGDGRFAFDVPDGWGTPVGAFGGFVGAALLDAMGTYTSAAGRSVRTLSLHFLRPLRPGASELVVVEEQTGRTMSRFSARAEQDGRPCILALASYASDYDTPAMGAEPMPAAPDPESVPRADVHDPAFTVWSRVDMRQTFGPLPASGGDDMVLGGWTSLRDGHPPDARRLTLYADCWWRTPWGRLTERVVAPSIDLTLHFQQPVAPDAGQWALSRFECTTVNGGFFQERGSLWSQDGTLLLHSTQMALLPSA